MSDTVGIDLGTTSIKVARFDLDGEMIACTSREYHEPDEHEVAFDQVWEALGEATRELIGSTRNRPGVVSIGLSSQTNSFGLMGEQGHPITPVWLWTADFAANEAAELNQRFGSPAIANAVGMASLTGQLLAPKCLHLKRHDRDTWGRLRSVRLLPDMVTFRLCGRADTDPSLWSLTGLYDLDSRDWWDPMAETLGIDRAWLPTLSAAGRPAGGLTRDVADELGLPAGIPVAVGALDHLAGAIGVGNARPGTASLSTGTASCVVVTHGDRPPAMVDGVVGRHPAAPELWYALTWTGLSSTGLNWYARQTGGEDRLAELLNAAGGIAPGADGWRAVPRDPNRGDAGFDFTRARPGHADGPSDAQAMRAILECISDEIGTLLTRAAQGQRIERLIAIGGGARSDVWLQLLADRLDVDLVRPSCIEASVRGASRFAALAAGQIGSLYAAPRAGHIFERRP